MRRGILHPEFSEEHTMSFILDRAAYKTAQLYRVEGHELIALLFLRKAYGR